MKQQKFKNIPFRELPAFANFFVAHVKYFKLSSELSQEYSKQARRHINAQKVYFVDDYADFLNHITNFEENTIVQVEYSGDSELESQDEIMNALPED